MSDLLAPTVALLPVVAFLALLRGMDAYRLVPLPSALRSLLAGVVAAAVSATLNRLVWEGLHPDWATMTRYLAPAVEELAKAVWPLALIRRHRCGFTVDGAIHGFAVGAGFSMLENVQYLRSMPDAGAGLWVVRGLGTAVMHGCTTAIVGIVAKDLSDRHAWPAPVWMAAALPGALILHSAFNHFLLPPLASTLLLLTVFPLVTLAVFARSERATRRWLGTGFDTDTELLELLFAGDLPRTPVGRYLESFRGSFAPEVVGDMLSYLQVRLELGVRAKGLLLARENGIEVPVGEDVRPKLDELRWLERRLGPAGRLALAPLVQRSSRDLWQLVDLDQRAR